MDAPPLEPGTLVAGRFTLERKLGEGAMGVIWSGRTEDDAVFALKFMKSVDAADQRRFRREARALRAAAHPGVVRVEDVVEGPSGELVMVMELLEGETLRARLDRERKLDLGSVAALALRVIDALAAAHAVGIVHRDLKPENVFLCRTSEPAAAVKVLDFGIAKLTAAEGLGAQSQALTGTGSIIGTPYYMSPEQVLAEKDLDARADVWSLGILLHECLSGARPTEADTVGRVLKRILMGDFEPLAKVCPELPSDVTSMVARMLVGDRADRERDLSGPREVLARYASRAEVDALAATIASSPPRAAPDKATVAQAETMLESSRELGDSGTDDARRGATASRPRRTALAVGLALAGATGAVALGLGSRGPAQDVRPTTTARAPAEDAEARPEPPHAAASPDAALSPPAAVTAASAEPSPPPVPSVAPVRPALLPAAPRCAPHETLSRGHCCARGLVWDGARCERPLATSF